MEVAHILVSDYASDPEAVRTFCEQYGICGEAVRAVDLVRKHFLATKPELEVEADPEGNGEWLVIRFDARGSVADVLDRYGRCKREWITAATDAGRSLIRFVYNII
jgi:hypothetical protein